MTVAHPEPGPDDLAEALLRTLTKLYVASRHIDMGRRASGQLTRAQYAVIQLVVERGCARVSELAQAAGVSLPTMSVAVSRLARRGLIHRRTPAAPRRNSCVELTARGASAFDAFSEARRRVIRTGLLSLSGDDREKLRVSVPVLVQLVSGTTDRINLTPSEML